MTSLKPFSGYALVKLIDVFDGLASIDQNINRATQGILVEATDPDQKKHEGEMVFWEEFRASEIIEHDGSKYSFVENKQLRGREYEVGEEIS
jgi:hypothetical protein